MLAQTPENSPLMNVVWFGCDGNAKSDKVSNALDKVIRVGTYSTLFESKGPAYKELAKKYKEKGFGDSPYQYAMNAYDAAWVLALAYVEVMDKNNGKYDPDLMAETIPVVTEKYSKGEYGVKPVSGYIKLNEWNDRASGDYAIWYVNKDCKWDAAGVWKFETKSIEWYHKPTPPVVETTAPAETTPAETTPVKTEKKTPGFEIALAVVGLLAVAYALRRH